MSVTAGQVRSINCTQCGAPLTLHGGHRVESLTCGFCGSVLDAHEDFKVVQTYANLNRPSSPLSLGMSGKLKNVEFTIIGVLEYRDAWHDRWLEYAIYSPTHGYAWLEDENGHFLFSRRVRTVPDTPIVGRVKSRFEAGGREFTVFSRYRAVITFIEGELPFMAAIGDAVEFIDAIDPPFVYTVEQTQTEQEYVLGEYLDAAEVYQSFGIEGKPDRRDFMHPAQPYSPSSWVSGLSKAGMVFAPIAVLLLLHSLFFGSGRLVVSADLRPLNVKNSVAVAERNFSVESAQGLVKLSFRVPKQKAWASFDVRVLQGGKTVYSLDKQLQASGATTSTRTYWSRAGTEVETYFTLPKAGQYTLSVVAKSTKKLARTAGRLHVELREGLQVSRYYFFLLCLTLLSLMIGPLQRLRFEARRWEDEDDG